MSARVTICVIVAGYYDSSHRRFSVFFFQAEDGIRDLVRSRGLGDVYKRQVAGRWLHGPGPLRHDERSQFTGDRRAHGDARSPGPVSYTHLTLPTSDLV